jgi:hypothetical protein
VYPIQRYFDSELFCTYDVSNSSFVVIYGNLFFITLLWAGPTIDARIIFAAVDTVNEIIYLFIKIPAVVWLMSIPPPIFWRNVPVS